MKIEKPEIILTLPWYEATLTITSHHTGIDGITATYNGKETRLIDFLNQSLIFEHEDHIEIILAKYEDKLDVIDITSLGAPDIPGNHQRINRSYYAVMNFATEADIVKAILSEYNAHLATYEQYFTHWDEVFNQWYQNYLKQTAKE